MRTERSPGLIETWSRDHSAALLGWARSRSSDPRHAEEVVAETLVKAWRRYDTFNPDRGSELTWLFAIARNTAVDHHRRARPARFDVESTGGLDAAGEAELDRIVEQANIRDALDSLSTEHRAVIIEAYFDGRSTREIAERHGIPAGTVKSRLFYGLRSLRAQLEERGVVR